MLVKVQNIMLDDDFAKDVTKIISYAATLGIRFLFTSGFRQDTNVQGAIVTPAKMSNHLTGTAFDCNLYVGNIFYNSAALSEELPTEIIKLINNWKSMGNRWGGDFAKRDVVHFDNGLNVHFPNLWKQKYDEYHN